MKFEEESIEDAGLEGRDHVFNVDEGVLSSVDLEHLQRLLDQVSQVLPLPLRVVNLVSEVHVLDLEQVQHW